MGSRGARSVVISPSRGFVQYVAGMPVSKPTGATAQIASAAVPRSVPDKALATVLKRLREERELTQEALGHAAGLTTSGYVKIEQGAAAPGWSTVRRLAAALDVTMVELSRHVEAE